MSKILVTGGAGFIGSNFIHYWLATHPKDEVINFDKLTYSGNLENLKDVAGDPQYKFVQGDICDPAAVEEAMRGVDAVVHFAAETHVDRSIMDPQLFLRTNVLGTQVLLEAAKKLGIKRFHHVSTDEVFGSLPLGSTEKWNEDTPYHPRSPYSASKAASDHLVRAYHASFSLPVTITNCANNIGPYLFPEKFLSLAITNLLEGKKVPVYKPGNQVREWLWVTDHVRAIDLVLQKGKIGETYFVAPENPELTNLEIIRKVLKIMNLGEDMIEFVKDRPGHDQRYAMDAGKIEQTLGWQPEIGIDVALARLVDWHRENEWWWKPLKEKNAEYFEQQYGS
ncbi:MAG: dTDP-glucose 4,6-dehydratase [Candidatus Doudnabacteria bacterium RIFCSPHIGHO2_02_FULL_48_21]|uniref:dTDP-glucose 4,6-dehydratase n=1 Tax=Candidatus Doudnabacteria bacterium RIFCSPLOWO2_02_FULL_48_13 TaxID=1817845 RepID=A0A1F5Q8B3_9BACT|nr:MAG: dTDP-glucose 4,6-dehydratase [Candidatus Doudnabacteria bacterium RIFCSPHIGHO2_01_48_18]OGE79879.1 MAG: dTDP-glucose 4,6-dehydratase [Candidatus Doudnabacteria bacterium RIFCSPHIGHO2_01_FULL_48_180]OGE91056.1 MAG: dTDP-glucose 4,6-dehydratase [Candidatus Doudnabacteria bacterium RIFCSPHIGHO2_12_FULL_47_25]OGE94042.1 MAG: dTDP-glucose 4,6-dehydratase [Candidatus Doudnabacteria bacterium RIFCSPHIGHO2_02_FULL_48_21]OGE98054.1 MAG: dTDP-glucose 4,6-dehydratase [Candidatus Doudnabacteria bac